jgi:integrase
LSAVAITVSAACLPALSVAFVRWRAGAHGWHGIADLRHNAASLFLAAGIDAHVVARMTGHDVAILQNVYHHLHPELTSEVFQRANDTVTRLRGRSIRALEAVPDASATG